MDDIPVRREKVVRRSTDGRIIVNDGNVQKPRQDELPIAGTKRSARATQLDEAARQDCKIYIGLQTRGPRTPNSERLRYSDQIGQRPPAHFLHNMTAIDLHGNLSESNLGCYLFVHHA